MKKKWLVLAAILTLSVLLGGMSLSASADTDGIQFQVIGTILTVSGSGTMQNYGSAQEAEWYEYRSVVDTVVIEGNVTSIGDYAFAGFEKLTTVYISENVTCIGKSAFYGCELLNDVGIYGNALASIGEAAFEGCEKLESLTLPNSLKTVGASAFKGAGLKVIVLGGVTEIGASGFENCVALKEIELSKQIGAIGANAFGGCGVEKIVIPESVTTFPANAFENCTALKRMVVCVDEQTWVNWNILLPQDTMVRFHDYHPDTSSSGSVCVECHEHTVEGNIFWDDMANENGKVIRPATHSITGLIEVTCPDCGKAETREIPTTEEHDYTDHYEKISDTHHKAFCECGEAYELQVHSAWERVDDETHKRDCVCEEPQTQPHTWNDGEVTSKPTHLTSGEKKYECTACPAEKTEILETLPDHTFQGNWTEHDADRHKQLCDCGTAQYEKHTWNDGKVTLKPTHLTSGEKKYECTVCHAVKTEILEKLPEHTFKGTWTEHDADRHKQLCDCGTAQYEKHAWDDGEVTQDPSHLEFGVKTFHCAACNATKTESIPKLTEHSFVGEWTKHDDNTHKKTCACGEEQHKQHSWDNGNVTKPASHMAEGKMQLTCLLCGATKTVTVEKLSDHVYAKNWTVEADCHTKKCACGEEIREDHRYGEWSLIQAATEEGEGKREKTCAVCGYTVSETIPAIEKNEGLSTGGVVGVTVSFAVILGVGGFWIVSPELMGAASPAASPKKRVKKSTDRGSDSKTE